MARDRCPFSMFTGLKRNNASGSFHYLSQRGWSLDQQELADVKLTSVFWYMGCYTSEQAQSSP
jgi:hypothetical protein